MKRVLVVAAHPDDEILGVAGTVRKYVNQGAKACAVILGEGQTSRFEKRNDAPKELVEQLHKDTYEAAEKIGYEKIYFADFPDNRFDHVDLLDIVKYIENIKNQFRPDVIYTHHGGDLNIDHQRTYEAVITATRPIKGQHIVKEIYTFETLSSSEWNFTYKKPFCPNVFENITDTFEAKLAAMKCYKSELCEFPHPRSINGLQVSAQRWGSVSGCEMAEAFELVRSVK